MESAMPSKLGDIDPHPEAKARLNSGLASNMLSTTNPSSLPGKLSEAEMRRLVSKKVKYNSSLGALSSVHNLTISTVTSKYFYIS